MDAFSSLLMSLVTLTKSPTSSCSSTPEFPFGGTNLLLQTTSGQESSGQLSQENALTVGASAEAQAAAPSGPSGSSSASPDSALARLSSMRARLSRHSRSSCCAESATRAGSSPSHIHCWGGGGGLSFNSSTSAAEAQSESSSSSGFTSEARVESTLWTKPSGNQPLRVGFSGGQPKAQPSLTALSCSTSPQRSPSVEPSSGSCQYSSTQTSVMRCRISRVVSLASSGTWAASTGSNTCTASAGTQPSRLPGPPPRTQ
mmetsp:Transcript_70065/g.198606  ORF Transcript_70065/g.198606 Transcript_70065/m.198606 type:complete len:258 (+) Transcript_70065:158-931(+)